MGRGDVFSHLTGRDSCSDPIEGLGSGEDPESNISSALAAMQRQIRTHFAVSSRETPNASWYLSSGPQMSCRISLSDVIPIALNAIAIGMSSLKELCRRYNRFALVVT